jgi:hypothetical protein
LPAILARLAHLPLSLDAFQQRGGGFVVRVLRKEFAGETTNRT